MMRLFLMNSIDTHTWTNSGSKCPGQTDFDSFQNGGLTWINTVNSIYFIIDLICLTNSNYALVKKIEGLVSQRP